MGSAAKDPSGRDAEMRALKQMAKVCLRPFYRGLKWPAGPLLRRLRDYLAAPALAQIDSPQAQLATHAQGVAAQVQQAMQAMQGMIHESDRTMWRCSSRSG
jgi:hypothetical protein